MSVKVEKLEKGMAKLTVEVEAAKLDEAVEAVYRKQRNRIQVPGFRKGKAPRSVIERMYGKEVFYQDAADRLVQDSYPDAADECGEDIVSSPEITVVQVEAGSPFIYTAEVALKPEVKLGKYKGIEVEKADLEVTDADIDAELDRVRKLNSREITVTDRAVQKDDTVKIDYEGFIDGEAFDGGKDEGHNLTIGSGTFIPGFEDQLIGKNIGDDVEVKVPFPDDYHEASLAGKEAVFKCHIHEIHAKELPELDDEFASDVSDFDTLEEYKADLKKTLGERKEKELRNSREDACVRSLILDSEMELPEAMILTQQRQILNEFMMQIQMQGMDPNQYLKMLGGSQERFLEQMRPQALERIQARLVLEAVAKAENITISDEEYEEKLKEIAARSYTDVAKLKEMYTERDEKQLRSDFVVEKAAKFLVDNVKEVKKAKTASAKAKKAEASDDGEVKETEEKKPAKKRASKKAEEKDAE